MRSRLRSLAHFLCHLVFFVSLSSGAGFLMNNSYEKQNKTHLTTGIHNNLWSCLRIACLHPWHSYMPLSWPSSTGTHGMRQAYSASTQYKRHFMYFVRLQVLGAKTVARAWCATSIMSSFCNPSFPPYLLADCQALFQDHQSLSVSSSSWQLSPEQQAAQVSASWGSIKHFLLFSDCVVSSLHQDVEQRLEKQSNKDTPSKPWYWSHNPTKAAAAIMNGWEWCPSQMWSVQVWSLNMGQQSEQRRQKLTRSLGGQHTSQEESHLLAVA